MTFVASKSDTSRFFNQQPAFVYGTAWKKDRTRRLVKEAIAAGFRRIDTAAQPRHYQEALVGEALREAYTEGVITTDQLHVCINVIGKIFD